MSFDDVIGTGSIIGIDSQVHAKIAGENCYGPAKLRMIADWVEARGTAWPVRRCAECAGRRLAFASARAAVEYDATVRRIVGAWKERGLRRLAAWAAAVVADTIAYPHAAPVTFVPADRWRLAARRSRLLGGLSKSNG